MKQLTKYLLDLEVRIDRNNYEKDLHIQSLQLKLEITENDNIILKKENKELQQSGKQAEIQAKLWEDRYNRMEKELKLVKRERDEQQVVALNLQKTVDNENDKRKKLRSSFTTVQSYIYATKPDNNVTPPDVQESLDAFRDLLKN